MTPPSQESRALAHETDTRGSHSAIDVRSAANDRDPADAPPTTAGSIRERARREMMTAITDSARRQLDTGGLANLSLRAITRELDMAPSSIYRYFASRDDLVTALLVDSYNDLGEAAQRALATTIGAPPLTRWRTVCQSVREWALAHTAEYLLLYGSPLPGYEAPQDTIAPASRVGLTLVAVVADAQRRGLLREMEPCTNSDLLADAQALAQRMGVAVPMAQIPQLIAVWSQLFGIVSFEILGQFHGMVTARAAFFDEAVTRLARQVGIE